MNHEPVVFAKRSCATEWRGRPVTVRQGEVWAADDPFVAAKPDLFGPPPRIRRTVAPVETAAQAPVETAAQAPGQLRRGRGSQR